MTMQSRLITTNVTCPEMPLLTCSVNMSFTARQNMMQSLKASTAQNANLRFLSLGPTPPDLPRNTKYKNQSFQVLPNTDARLLVQVQKNVKVGGKMTVYRRTLSFAVRPGYQFGAVKVRMNDHIFTILSGPLMRLWADESERIFGGAYNTALEYDAAVDRRFLGLTLEDVMEPPKPTMKTTVGDHGAETQVFVRRRSRLIG